MIDRQAIRAYLQTQVGKEVSFDDDDSLLASQLIDSLKIAELIVYLEDTYKVTFDNDDLTPDNLDSVDAIVGFLERKGIA